MDQGGPGLTPSRSVAKHTGRGRAGCNRVEQRGADRGTDLLGRAHGGRGHSCLPRVHAARADAECRNHRAADPKTRQNFSGKNVDDISLSRSRRAKRAKPQAAKRKPRARMTRGGKWGNKRLTKYMQP